MSPYEAEDCIITREQVCCDRQRALFDAHNVNFWIRKPPSAITQVPRVTLVYVHIALKFLNLRQKKEALKLLMLLNVLSQLCIIQLVVKCLISLPIIIKLSMIDWMKFYLDSTSLELWAPVELNEGKYWFQTPFQSYFMML